MDLLERVRDIESDAPTLTETQVDTARQALLREIARGEKQRTPAHTKRRWIGGISLAAGVASVAIVAGAIVAPHESSSAAEVLNRAADVTVNATEPELKPGQYLRVSQTFDGLVLWDVDMPADWARFNNGDPREADAAVRTRQTYDLYVPEDRNETWVQTRSNQEVVETFGPRGDEALSDLRRTQGGLQDGQTDYLKGGKYSGKDGGEEGSGYLDHRDQYASMPRDPQKMLDKWQQATDDTGARGNWATFTEAIEDVNSANLAPADLRETMFRALALIDGVTVIAVDGDLTTLACDGKTGKRTFRTTLTIDTERGLIVGGSGIELTPGLPSFLPSPAVVNSWSVETTVVDAAP